MTTYQIATDGSCIQQGSFRAGDQTERPGAAGFVIKAPDGRTAARAEPQPNGLIGGMEVKGLRMALEFAASHPDPQSRFEIKADSQYAVKGFTEWLPGWAKKGYHKPGGLAYADEWREIDRLKQALGGRVDVGWVKAHNGHPLNEQVDALVNSAARSQMPVDTLATLFPHHSAARATPVPSAAIAHPVPTAVSAELPFADKPLPGVRAQAMALLSQASHDQELAAVVAKGLDMILASPEIAARYESGALERATKMRDALDQVAR